jgi:hypothetical protein
MFNLLLDVIMFALNNYYGKTATWIKDSIFDMYSETRGVRYAPGMSWKQLRQYTAWARNQDTHNYPDFLYK